MQKFIRFILLLMLLATSSSLALAQDVQWSERTTAYFSILYAPGSETQADSYAGFIDQLFEEVTGTFGHRPATPISLLLYPDLESYYQANPRARGLGIRRRRIDHRRKRHSQD